MTGSVGFGDRKTVVSREPASLATLFINMFLADFESGGIP